MDFFSPTFLPPLSQATERYAYTNENRVETKHICSRFRGQTFLSVNHIVLSLVERGTKVTS